jgi:hypothetical protein
MSLQSLPDRPSLEQLRRQAKELRDAARAGDPTALARVAAHVPNDAAHPVVTLSAAQLVVAREHGFASWPRLRRRSTRARGIWPTGWRTSCRPVSARTWRHPRRPHGSTWRRSTTGTSACGCFWPAPPACRRALRWRRRSASATSRGRGCFSPRERTRIAGCRWTCSPSGPPAAISVPAVCAAVEARCPAELVEVAAQARRRSLRARPGRPVAVPAGAARRPGRGRRAAGSRRRGRRQDPCRPPPRGVHARRPRGSRTAAR